VSGAQTYEEKKLTERSPLVETLQASGNGLWAKFGQEIVAGAYKRPNQAPHHGAQADSGHGSGCSPLAQVEAAAAHVWRLKRNQ
jgi:hypothetical protein